MRNWVNRGFQKRSKAIKRETKTPRCFQQRGFLFRFESNLLQFHHTAGFFQGFLGSLGFFLTHTL